MSFLWEYIKHPRRIGAVAPSSRHLARCMMEPIDFAAARTIVEYGPGQGAFSRELISRRRRGARLLLIEQNETFCQQLQEEFSGLPDLHIVGDSAAQVNRHLAALGWGRADYVVSGLPFTSLPPAVTAEILEATRQAIGADGSFITFQYSLIKKSLFECSFRVIRTLRELHNLPPAWILVMQSRL